MDRLQRFGIEYNLAEHCNLTCAGCNHASPLFPKKLAALEQFEADLTALAPVLHVRELRIVGGEPLLHPQLCEFLRIGRRLAIADRIVLYTNGLLLHEAPAEMWELIDDLWVSIYPGVERKLSFEALQVITREHGVRLRPAYVDSFTLTLLNGRIDEPALVQKIFDDCDLAHAWSCHAIHEGRYYKCAQAPFLQYRLSRLGLDVDNREADGVPLHGNPDLRGALERYLADTRPLTACDYCLGTSGPVRPHRVLNKRGLDEWLAEDHTAAIADTRARLAIGDAASGR